MDVNVFFSFGENLLLAVVSLLFETEFGSHVDLNHPEVVPGLAARVHVEALLDEFSDLFVTLASDCS